MFVNRSSYCPLHRQVSPPFQVICESCTARTHSHSPALTRTSPCLLAGCARGLCFLVMKSSEELGAGAGGWSYGKVTPALVAQVRAACGGDEDRVHVAGEGDPDGDREIAKVCSLCIRCPRWPLDSTQPSHLNLCPSPYLVHNPTNQPTNQPKVVAMSADSLCPHHLQPTPCRPSHHPI